MKKFLTVFLCVFMSVVTFFSSGCVAMKTAFSIGAKLEEKNYEVHYADSNEVLELLDGGFGLQYYKGEFTRGVFAVHKRIDCFVYVIFCKDTSVARTVKKDMDENMYVFAEMYEISFSEMKCVRQANIIYCGHKEAVDIARK